MEKKSLSAYLAKFPAVFICYLDPLKGPNNYKEEISLLVEYADKFLAQEKSVCFLSKTEQDCKEFRNLLSVEKLKKLRTFSVNEIQFLGPTPDYNTELGSPSDIIIIHSLEHYPRLEMLQNREKILFTTKSLPLFDVMGKMSTFFERIIVRYQNDENLFLLTHHVNLEQK